MRYIVIVFANQTHHFFFVVVIPSKEVLLFIYLVKTVQFGLDGLP